MNMPNVGPIPRRARHLISPRRGAIGGYATLTYHNNYFTVWDKGGRVLYVLIKPRGGPWRIKEERRYV